MDGETHHTEILRHGHSVWAFPAIYLTWAYLCWLPLFGSEQSVWTFPNLFFFLAGGASPLIAGISLAWFTGGKAQLLDLWKRLIDIRRITPGWLLFILVYWLAFDLLMAGLALLFGISDQPLDIAWHLLTEPAKLGFLLLLAFLFPAVEEIGHHRCPAMATLWLQPASRYKAITDIHGFSVDIKPGIYDALQQPRFQVINCLGSTQ